MKIRLHGTIKELKEFTALIKRVTELQACSAPYKDRGESKFYRVYLDVVPMVATVTQTIFEIESPKFIDVKSEL